MRVWKHEGPGHYIGSCVMCMAETEEKAKELIRVYLDQMGLKSEPVDLRWHRTDVEGVFHAVSGDY